MLKGQFKQTIKKIKEFDALKGALLKYIQIDTSSGFNEVTN
jgi:hypothetical protein